MSAGSAEDVPFDQTEAELPPQVYSQGPGTLRYSIFAFRLAFVLLQQDSTPSQVSPRTADKPYDKHLAFG